MSAPSSAHRKTVRRFAFAALVAVCLATATNAGPLPNLLDDNRGNTALEALESAAFNLALTALPIFSIPFTPAYAGPPILPVVIDGRVLEHPKIHNLYLDSDWDANNPD